MQRASSARNVHEGQAVSTGGCSANGPGGHHIFALGCSVCARGQNCGLTSYHRRQRCVRPCLVKSSHFWKGNGLLGVYPLVLRPFGGRVKTRPRNVLPRARTGLKRNSASPSEMPEALAKHAHDFFFFGHVLQPNGTAAHEGANEAPPLTTCRGGITPRTY